MKVRVDFSILKKSKWQNYAVRFVFGGIITALTGILASKFGPTVGGLFLAFPAILPASVTLVEKHEDKEAAGFDTLGAALGSIGLLAFALIVWVLAWQLQAWAVLAIATVVWFAVAMALWVALQKFYRPKRGYSTRGYCDPKNKT